MKQIRAARMLGILFVLPTMLVLATAMIYPLLSIFVYSVQSLSAGSGSFVGLGNYRSVVRSTDFTGSLLRSIAVTLLSVALTAVLGMIIALMLNGEFSGRGFARSLVILPWAMPTFVAAFVWRWMLDYNYGAVNHILVYLHLSQTPVLFFGKNTALVTASVVYAWKGVPWAAMVLLAGLQVVPHELRDAARVDGASAWAEWWHVTLPSMRFVIEITVILLLVWNFNWFEMMWLLTEGGPGRATAVLPIDVYLQAFRAFSLGNASALSVIILLILLSVTFVMFRVWAREEAAL